MNVKDLMTGKPQYLSKSDSVQKAAQKMKALDCGFIPVGDNDRLDGVVTDRDIVLRCVAEGKDATKLTCADVISHRVLYCIESDNIKDVARNMGQQQVSRLIVLNNREEKRMTGVISLGDISRYGNMDALVGETSEHLKKVA
jgi:CBS domain-containing protein